MTNTLLISFSGGNTSRFMTEYIMASKKYEEFQKIIVFANTSKENLETLDFVNKCDRYYKWNVVWLEAVFNDETKFRITNYKNAKRNGEVFEDMLKVWGISNISFPHCSRELKENPIKRFMRKKGYKPSNYLSAVGIRADEPHRLIPKKNVIYPLATDLQVDERFIIEWSARQSIQLKLKSYEGNCDFCWKKSKRKKMTIALESPKIPAWWQQMEEKYSQGKYYFHRMNQSTKELVQDAKTLKFDKAVDSGKVIIATPELDFEKPCLCKV